MVTTEGALKCISRPVFHRLKKCKQTSAQTQSEPALEEIRRAAPSVVAHHYSVSPDTGRNFGGRRIIIKNKCTNLLWIIVCGVCCVAPFVVAVVAFDTIVILGLLNHHHLNNK